jgi:hypothetical protein
MVSKVLGHTQEQVLKIFAMLVSYGLKLAKLIIERNTQTGARLFLK